MPLPITLITVVAVITGVLGLSLGGYGLYVAATSQSDPATLRRGVGLSLSGMGILVCTMVLIVIIMFV